MLTNAYGELEEYMAGYGRVTSDIKWAAIGDREVGVERLLMQLEGTLYYKKNHVGRLNPKMVLAGEGFSITRGEDDISGECWVFHSYLVKPMFASENYSIWMGAPGGDSEKARRLKIYVAGQYFAHDKERIVRNVRTAIDVGIALFHKGHFPFIPHLTHYVERRADETNNHLGWKEYMMRDLAWLEVADALYFIGRSKETDTELEAARSHGLDIYYAMSDVPDVCGKPLKNEEERK